MTIDRDYFARLPDCEVEAKPIDDTESIADAIKDGMKVWQIIAVCGLVAIVMGTLWAIFAGGAK